jgi:23S rRNA (uracil1939-C5)-methyltransferase
MIQPGARIELDVAKPAAGGRMIARHDGQVVLVWGAIPGERVVAHVERVSKGVAFADVVDVVVPSSDRRPVESDWRCGGNVLAHVAYPRQVQLKAQIVQDAFLRIGRVPLPQGPEIMPSPERGYRMRARLHAHGGRIGFFREGTHQLCDAARTGQLLPATCTWIARAQELLDRERAAGLTGIEITENVSGDERACHLELGAGADPSMFAALADGLVGLSTQREGAAATRLAGVPVVTDDVAVRDGGPALQLRRDVRAFFQGNRFLLEPFVRHVIARVPDGPVIDLYAGVGLFGLALAANGLDRVTLVEGDAVSGGDLAANAQPYVDRVRVERRSVEEFLRRGRALGDATFVIDPPRTGLSRDALAGIVQHAPARIVYVSCDVATLARDTRVLLDAGYELEALTGADLFPNTAHIESVAVLTR